MSILVSPIVGEIQDQHNGKVLVVLMMEHTLPFVSVTFQTLRTGEAILQDKLPGHTPEAKRPSSISVQLPQGYYRVLYACPNGRVVYQHLLRAFARLGRIIAVSCDNLEMDLRHSVWDHAAHTITHQPLDNTQTVVFHLGDNIYADGQFNIAWRKKLSIPETAELFRERYRQTWKTGSRPTVLSGASNIMIWDDHEIVNDIVWNTTKYHNGQWGAVDAYMEYQVPLHAPDLDHKRFNIAPTCRSSWIKLYNNAELAIVCVSQVEAVRDVDRLCEILQADLPRLPQLKHLLIGTTWAPMPHPHGFRLKSVFEDMTPKFMKKEQCEKLYEIVFHWLRLNPAVRRAVIVGGDIHFAYHGYVTDVRDNLKFELVSSSPVTNTPTPARIRSAHALRDAFMLNNILKITPRVSAARRAYAIIDIADDSKPFPYCNVVLTGVQVPANPFKAVMQGLHMAGVRPRMYQKFHGSAATPEVAPDGTPIPPEAPLPHCGAPTKKPHEAMLTEQPPCRDQLLQVQGGPGGMPITYPAAMLQYPGLIPQAIASH